MLKIVWINKSIGRLCTYLNNYVTKYKTLAMCIIAFAICKVIYVRINFYFRNSEKHFFITSESFVSYVAVWHTISTYMEFTNVKRVFGTFSSINGMGLLHFHVNFVDKLEFN